MFASPLSGRQIQSELSGRMSRGIQPEVEGGRGAGLWVMGRIVPAGVVGGSVDTGRGLSRETRAEGMRYK